MERYGHTQFLQIANRGVFVIFVRVPFSTVSLAVSCFLTIFLIVSYRVLLRQLFSFLLPLHSPRDFGLSWCFFAGIRLPGNLSPGCFCQRALSRDLQFLQTSGFVFIVIFLLFLRSEIQFLEVCFFGSSISCLSRCFQDGFSKAFCHRTQPKPCYFNNFWNNYFNELLVLYFFHTKYNNLVIFSLRNSRQSRKHFRETPADSRDLKLELLGCCQSGSHTQIINRGRNFKCAFPTSIRGLER